MPRAHSPMAPGARPNRRMAAHRTADRSDNEMTPTDGASPTTSWPRSAHAHRVGPHGRRVPVMTVLLLLLGGLVSWAPAESPAHRAPGPQLRPRRGPRPSSSTPSIVGPGGSLPAPTGALWFTNPGNNSIGRITTAGVVANFTPQHLGSVAHRCRVRTARCGSPTTGTTRSAGSPPAERSPTTPIPASPARASPPVPTARCGSRTRNNSIGRITTGGSGHQLHRYRHQFPNGIVTGPTVPCGSPTTAIPARSDGSPPPESVTRLAPPGSTTRRQPRGPGGALWFTTPDGRIWRITAGGRADGLVRERTAPTASPRVRPGHCGSRGSTSAASRPPGRSRSSRTSTATTRSTSAGLRRCDVVHQLRRRRHRSDHDRSHPGHHRRHPRPTGCPVGPGDDHRQEPVRFDVSAVAFNGHGRTRRVRQRPPGRGRRAGRGDERVRHGHDPPAGTATSASTFVVTASVSSAASRSAVG